MTKQGEAATDGTPIRVLIVDDQTIVRKGIRALLAEVENIRVVGEARNGQEAVAQARALEPDVTLMDLAMPEMDGIEAIRQITTHQPAARIVVLTSFVSDDKVFPAIKAGALGYLLKDSEPADLIRAIEQANRGEPSLHPSIASKVLQELRRPASKTPPPNALTPREVEVLSLVAKGMSNREIAAQLSTTEATIKTHVSAILGKLHLANRVQAGLYALQDGATSLADALDRERESSSAFSAPPVPRCPLWTPPPATRVVSHTHERMTTPPRGGRFLWSERPILLPMASSGGGGMLRVPD